MLKRYRAEETKKLAETIYRLRQYGWTHQEFADEMGKTLPYVMQIAKRELAYRCSAFKYPFIEYIVPRTEKAIKKCLGESILREPEKLSRIEQVKALMCWAGMKDGVMRDLGKGLPDAGYESFEPRKMRDAIFITR